MDFVPTSSSEAAQLVLKERQRQREAEKNSQPKQSAHTAKSLQPALETVSVPRWEGEDQGQVDESELDRRQRALQEKLERKQLEFQRQGKRLAKVRQELKSLEEPIRAEIMKIRQQLEYANREEIELVNSVNTLRTELHTKENSLKVTRQAKQDLADKLIGVMAGYEKKKTARLNEIAELVGEDVPKSKSTPNSTFSGF